MRRGGGADARPALGGLALACALATSAGGQPARAPASPGSVAHAVAAATQAVEDGTAAAHAHTLRARLALAATDRAAALGLATVARLTYDWALADSLLAALTAGAADDPVRAYALVGRAHGRSARGFVVEADSVFGLAVAAARGASEPAALAEALLGRAGARARAAGMPAALATLDSADAALAAAASSLDPRARARLRATAACGRASLLTRAGSAGVLALVDSGIALAAGASTRALGACHFARAQEHARVGDMWRANGALDSAAALLRRAGDRPLLAAVLQWRGYAALSVGALEAAQRHLAEALAEATASEALLPMAWALINVGQVASSAGALDEATRYFTRAEAVLARIGDEQGIATARALLAGLALQGGDARGARARFEANRRWAERAADWQTHSESLRGLSQVAARERDWPAAQALLDSAAAIMLARGGARWAPIHAWYQGVLALRRGDGARAERELRAALPAYVAAQGSARYRLRAGIAHARLLQGDTAGAAAELREASDALDAWRESLATDRLRAAAYQHRDISRDPPSVETVIAGVAASGRVAAAFDLAERRRARMLRDALVHAGSGRDDVARGAASDTARVAARDASSAGASPGARPDASPGASAGGGAVTVGALGAALPDARSALALVVAGPDGAPGTLFVVTRAGAVAHSLPPDDSLAALAERLRARIEDGADAAGPARALGEALFGVGGARLPRGVARLVVVPDGALHRAPLAAVDPDGRGPLGARVELAAVPSATVAALLWARPRAPARPPRVLAVGDPAFGAPASGDPAPGNPAPGAAPRAEVGLAAREAGALPRLPRSADEARAAARLAPGSRVLLGGEASEAALRALPPGGFSVVHLATHAFVDDARPWASLVALAPGGGHDGFLRATELAALPLAADLVVLSACATAGGAVVGGEGVQGFAAALLAVGTRAVVATHWALRDDEAARATAALYGGLGDGLTVGDALRRARRELRAAGAPARVWAALTLVGDPTVRPAPRRGSWLARLIGR